MGLEHRAGSAHPGFWSLLAGLTVAASACATGPAPAMPRRPAPVVSRQPPPPSAPPMATHSAQAAAAESGENDQPPRTLDLARALEMGGASSLQAALAREQLALAHARLDQAKVLWLPNLWAGAIYTKDEGALQETEGNILTVSRNSGFVGGGLFASFNLADAVLEPRSARLEVDAAGADVARSVNDTLLGVALAYNDLLEAQARVTLAQEGRTQAAHLADLAAAYSNSGQGLESDAARARSELARLTGLTLSAQLALETQAARLATLLRLDPTLPLRASDARLIPLALLPEEIPLDELIDLALSARPEIQSRKSIVQAEAVRQNQEQLRPFIPRLELALRTGAMAGGTGSEVDNLGETGALRASLVWGLRNLGLGETAARKRKAAQTRSAKIQLQIARDAITQQVTVAYLQAHTGRRQVELAAQNVEQAQHSLDLNLQRIQAGEGLPLEALQALQAAASARETYLETVGNFNRSQFHLLRALGRAPPEILGAP